MLDVLLVCHPEAHTEKLCRFPEVRGFYLAQHLRKLGLAAEFTTFPVRDRECRVLICTDYARSTDWVDEHVARHVADIHPERAFCVLEYALGNRDHRLKPYSEWFARRGGVLCQLRGRGLGHGEHWIGVGVDPEIVRPNGPRDTIVFDFPFDPGVKEPAWAFDRAWVEILRRKLPQYRVIGTGWPDSPNRHLFDEWVPYGIGHSKYVDWVLGRALALVVGWRESLGLVVAEAQVAGACVLATSRRVKRWMLCEEAGIHYDGRSPRSLAAAVTEAAQRDRDVIRRRASDKFDLADVAQRTRAAIGL
jgi:glycosyltransferase involved in cell wall biosynthesis